MSETLVQVQLEGHEGKVHWDNSYIPRDGDTLRLAGRLWKVTHIVYEPDIVYEAKWVTIHATAKEA